MKSKLHPLLILLLEKFTGKNERDGYFVQVNNTAYTNLHFTVILPVPFEDIFH
jgi:hypothetical protein